MGSISLPFYKKLTERLENMNNIKWVTIATSSVLLILLIGIIVWASIESNVIVGFDQVLSTRWGIATMVDIYISLTFIGVWIGVMENSILKGVIWTLFLYLLGNIVTLGYFIVRIVRSRLFIEVFLPKSIQSI